MEGKCFENFLHEKVFKAIRLTITHARLLPSDIVSRGFNDLLASDGETSPHPQNKEKGKSKLTSQKKVKLVIVVCCMACMLYT